MRNDTKITFDMTSIINELISIKGSIWAYAECTIPEGEQWDKFVRLADKYSANWMLQYIELNRGHVLDADEAIADIRKNFPDLK
jgi:hypothetical protein